MVLSGSSVRSSAPAGATLVVLAASLMLGLLAFSPRDASAAGRLSLSGGPGKATQIVAAVGERVTIRARWRGAKRLPRGAQIVIRYARADAAGTKAVGRASARRRLCRRNASSCAWLGEVSRVATARAYHAVVERNGRTISRSTQSVVVRWRSRPAKQSPSPYEPLSGPPAPPAAAGSSAGNQAPVAVASGSPLSGTVPFTATFSSAGSSDPDGSISGYAWDLDGDGQFDDSAAANPSFQYTTAGSYEVRVRVTDSSGAQRVSSALAVSAATMLSFASPETIATGSQTHSVVAADLDGDSDKDLVAAVADSNAVAVVRNNDSGAFGARVLYSTSAYPKHAAVGDVNGDGKPDLVSANQEDNSITVLKGNGDGTFQDGIRYATCVNPHEAAFGDLNGDGRQDVAVACFGGSVISVLFNQDSAGTLGSRVDRPTAAGAHSLVLRDFDGDGDLDVAEAVLFASEVTVLINPGSGVLGAPVRYPYPSPHNVSSADLNGDGKFDLVATSQTGNAVGVLLGNGDGTFQSPISYPVGPVPKATSIGDLNGDGKLDLVTANSHDNYPFGSTATTLTILHGNGNGTFSTGATLPNQLTPFSVAIADFNGDGMNDIASANWHSGDIKIIRHT